MSFVVIYSLLYVWRWICYFSYVRNNCHHFCLFKRWAAVSVLYLSCTVLSFEVFCLLDNVRISVMLYMNMLLFACTIWSLPFSKLKHILLFFLCSFSESLPTNIKQRAERVPSHFLVESAKLKFIRLWNISGTCKMFSYLSALSW
jgi:hypothetical protein